MSWAYLLLDKLAGYLQYIARGRSGKAGRAILSDVVRGHFWFLIIDAQIAADSRACEKVYNSNLFPPSIDMSL